ncbi:MAG: DUF488 domain-containing protein [Terriglobales bacterium]
MSRSPQFQLKRAYDPAAPGDGARFLVERLWPRGLKKSALPLTAWLKDVAPSTQLRQWFAHDPAKWAGFQTRYGAELKSQPEAWAPLLAAARQGPVTLIYSAHDPVHNNAVALRSFLLRRRR